ncbi:hypothetical protein [Echinicola shivajiensis]|uniref:hypothetical protein n=1 Tax=Echinicola shivajiensis TaxID=1035916 RepID=UPI001BFC4C50|nr:hypothetical protein [Echinicola shivajiensis]
MIKLSFSFLFAAILSLKVCTVTAFQVSDSVATISFLNGVDKVESMYFKLKIKDDQVSPNISPQSAQLKQILSKVYYDFERATFTRDSLINAGISNTDIQYYIFDDVKEFKEVIDYISIVKKNELYIPKTEKAQTNEELIIAASRIPFKPFYKLKYRIFNDAKFIILLGILGLFLITFLVLLFFLTIVRSKNAKQKKLIKEYKLLCQAPISSLLFEYSYTEIESMTFDRLSDEFGKTNFSKALFKDTLIKEIVNVNKNLKGEFKDKLRAIYTILELDKFSLSKLKSRNWDEQSSGIVELFEMNIGYTVDEIEKLIYSKNFIVRTNAVRAVLHLSIDKNLKFLAQQKYPLSKWEQMSIYRVLKNIPKTEKVGVAILLDSENHSVRLFGIRLVRFLGKIELIEKLSSMYDSVTYYEQQEILKSFKALTAFGELELIHKVLMGKDNPLSILAANLLADIGNEDSIEFLCKKVKETKNFKLQKCILTSLHALDEQRFELEVQNLNQEHIYLIKNHIKDSLLSYV